MAFLGRSLLDQGFYTDPLVADTDSGGVDDGDEDVNHDGALDQGETDPTAGHQIDDDADGDGIPTIQEDPNRNGVLDPGETDPNDVDTDGDGIEDGVEDTDQDGVRDPGESDPADLDSDRRLPAGSPHRYQPH